MVFTVEPVAHLSQAHCAGHVLQFAVTVCGTGQAVQRVVGDVQLHDVAPQSAERLGLRTHLHAVLDGRRAGGGVTRPTLDLDKTQPA